MASYIELNVKFWTKKYIDYIDKIILYSAA